MVHALLDENICILWSTAYLDEAEKCNTVLLLNEGKLHFFGRPKDLTDRVKGRVFRIEKAENKRSLLRKLIDLDAVVDGVIEGDDLRLVLKSPKGIPGLDLKETTPRFEDAFVDLLENA